MKRLSLAACLALLLPVQAEAQALRELRWLHENADKLAALTTAPNECLSRAESRQQHLMVEAGRVLFHTPEILGGLAARNGLNCNACHPNGHDNPNFYLEGLSGDPGTVDATSAVFSKTRDDGQFNPIPIPSLVDAYRRENFGHAQQISSLEEFIHGVVVEEFQGAPPNAKIMAALTAYVAALDSQACPTTPQPTLFAQHVEDSRRALDAVRNALDAGEGEFAALLVLGVQEALERVHERFVGDKFEKQRREIEFHARALTFLRATMREHPQRALALFDRRQQMILECLDGLEVHLPASLYNPLRLEASLAQ